MFTISIKGGFVFSAILGNLLLQNAMETFDRRPSRRIMIASSCDDVLDRRWPVAHDLQFATSSCQSEHDFLGSHAKEGCFQRCEFPEHKTATVHVRRQTVLLFCCALWWHVADSSCHASELKLWAFLWKYFGQAEIVQLHLVFICEATVLWLDVAMKDIFSTQVTQSQGNLDAYLEAIDELRWCLRRAPFLKAMSKCACQSVKDKEEVALDTVLQAIDAIDRYSMESDDIWVSKICQDLCFDKKV